MKFQPSKYKKIIFDMDGVITNELAYWRTAALSAYDLLTNYEFFGKCGIDRPWCRKNYIEIYNTIMCGGRTVKAVKRLGVNTNWDLCYVVFCVSKYINPDLDTLDAAHFQSVCMFIENVDMKAPEIYGALSELCEQAIPNCKKGLFDHEGDFFKDTLFNNFNMWYLGNDELEGLKITEAFLFPDEDVRKVLLKLKDMGIRLGIGTGRPTVEIDYPLKQHKIDDCFDKNLYCAFDEVYNAQKDLNLDHSLTKPDPFVFLKAAIGENHTDKEIVDGDYTYEELEDTLVVGDAPSDLMSAKRAGFDFLGVLTGVEGETIRPYFEENNADYILPSVLEMCE